MGTQPLSMAFPRLFSLSNQQDRSTGQIVSWVGGSLGWDLTWRRSLFVWEEGLLEELLSSVPNFLPSVEPDEWYWRRQSDGVYSVRSTYAYLSADSNPVFDLFGPSVNGV